MITYKLIVADRDYNDVCYYNSLTLNKIDLDLDFSPRSHKMFNQDIFEIKGNRIKVLHSMTREMTGIPGVINCSSNKTFGKYKNKFLYKCIPDDRRMPIFLIPYSIKYEFSKNITNKYCVFKFKKWIGKHPIATLVETIGDVSELNNFYEYQLYCKSLYASIQQFTKKTMKALRHKSEDHFVKMICDKYSIEDRTEINVFTIDPEVSKDFDDGISLVEDDISYKLSIYISNVSFWLDILGLWGSFSKRISTIYLPDRKRPMLPTILSDALCSLTEGHIRFAITLDLMVNKETHEIMNMKFLNTMVKVRRNFRYDTKELEKDKTYKKVFELVKNMNRVERYTDKIVSSHEVIAYLMILMNYITAKELRKKECGVYRSSKFNNKYKLPEKAPKECKKFLKLWNSFGGKYVKFDDIESHDWLELDAYVHMTSPIRRLVDLLNLIKIQEILKIGDMSKEGKEFYMKWTTDESLEYINKTMRSIRKVQNDCSLLEKCINDKHILKREHAGYIFDKIQRNDHLYQYMIYLPEIRMVNRFVSRHDRKVFTENKFKIFTFIDETQLKQKIRVELVTTE